MKAKADLFAVVTFGLLLTSYLQDQLPHLLLKAFQDADVFALHIFQSYAEWAKKLGVFLTKLGSDHPDGFLSKLDLPELHRAFEIAEN